LAGARGAAPAMSASAGAAHFDVDISVARGDFVRRVAFCGGERIALVGPSGCGKSTTLLAIAGLVRPLAGHIRLAGRTLFDAAAGIDIAARDRGLGIVFQDNRLFPHLDVRANLAYAGRANPDEVAAMADRLGIAPLLARWPRHLSGGEARRVALGRALLARPGTLLLDEPLAHLDPQRGAALLDLIAATAATALLYITHDIGEARRLGAEVIAIDVSAQQSQDSAQ